MHNIRSKFNKTPVAVFVPAFLTTGLAIPCREGPIGFLVADEITVGAMNTDQAPVPKHVSIHAQLTYPLEETMKPGKNSCAKIKTLAFLLLLAAVFTGCAGASEQNQRATDIGASSSAPVTVPRSKETAVPQETAVPLTEPALPAPTSAATAEATAPPEATASAARNEPVQPVASAAVAPVATLAPQPATPTAEAVPEISIPTPELQGEETPEPRETASPPPETDGSPAGPIISIGGPGYVCVLDKGALFCDDFLQDMEVEEGGKPILAMEGLTINLPPEGESFMDVSVSWSYACALREDGSPICWSIFGSDHDTGTVKPPPTGERFTSH